MLPSKNSIAQAVRILRPELKREEFFRVIRTPQCCTSVNRYWRQTYNILDWARRSEAEQQAALRAAGELLAAHDARTAQVTSPVT
jgi:hypothetical protein